MRLLQILTALFLLTSAAPLQGATFLDVPVADLSAGADAVVVARILDEGESFVAASGNPATRWQARVLRSHAGPIGDDTVIEIVERGGEIGGQGLLVTGTPEYQLGETLLLFLTRRPDGRWRAHQHEQGVFRSVAGEWRRNGAGTRLRADSMALEALGIESWLLIGEKNGVSAPVRHRRFELRDRFTLHVSGTAARFSAARRYVELATSAWNDDGASHVYLVRGEDATAAYAVEDGVSAVVLDATIPDADSSVVGQTTIFYNSTVTGDGEPYFEIEEADVAIRGGLLISNKIYAEIITHELGHVLGFRHSNDGTPASSDAVMNSGISGRFGPSLGSWDREALAAVYPQLTPSCTTPLLAISGHEARHEHGSDVELHASVTTGDVDTIEWFRGVRGDTAHPLGTGASLRLVEVTESFAFWVRATGPCGFSETPTLELLVEFCDPANLVDLQFPAVVAKGASATVRAIVGGELPLKIEWFDAHPASGAAPIAEGETFVTAPLTAATEFWVRPSNRCGDSPVRAFTIDVATHSRRRGARPPGHSAGSAAEAATLTTRSLPVYQMSPSHASRLIALTAPQ